MLFAARSNVREGHRIASCAGNRLLRVRLIEFELCLSYCASSRPLLRATTATHVTAIQTNDHRWCDRIRLERWRVFTGESRDHGANGHGAVSHRAHVHHAANRKKFRQHGRDRSEWRERGEFRRDIDQFRGDTSGRGHGGETLRLPAFRVAPAGSQPADSDAYVAEHGAEGGGVVAIARQRANIRRPGSDMGGVISNMYFLPPTLGRSLEGAALEDVVFMRDEMANLAWAIERSVESPPEQPRNYALPVESGNSGDPADSPRYLLASTVPENWIPLLPVQTTDPAGKVISRLKRGAVLQPDGTQQFTTRRAKLSTLALICFSTTRMFRAKACM
jgi:hypothetical protein